MFLSKNNKFNFKITVVSLVLVSTVIFFIPFFSSAQTIVPQIEGLTTADIRVVAGSIIQLFLGLLGLIALVIILYAGFVWMTSGGNEEKISKAKKILSAGVIGLMIILSAYAITTFILDELQDALNSSSGYSSGNRDGGFGSGLGGGALGGGIVEYHYPERDATNIPRNTMIMITLKVPVNSEHVIGDLFTDATCAQYEVDGSECGKLADKIHVINDGNEILNENIIAVLTPDAKRILIKPIAPLGNSDTNTYTSITLDSNMESADGQVLFPGLTSGYIWQFEISTFLDLTPPEVTFVWPAQNDTVARNAIVQINFSEPINILDVNNTNIDISGLSGNLVISNEYRTVEFLSDLACGGSVTVNSCGEDVFCLPANSLISGVIENISDASGNVMPTPYDWSFNTNDTINLIPPVITEVNPNSSTGLTNVQRNPNPRVSATFDSIISPSSLNTDSFYIYNVSSNLCNQDPYEDDEGKDRIDSSCLPDYSVYVSENNSYKCNIKIYSPYLDQTSSYRPRLTSKIKDSYGNCFNPAEDSAENTGQQ
jgi:type IV secretion system pilin/Big-like domain-containing protein